MSAKISNAVCLFVVSTSPDADERAGTGTTRRHLVTAGTSGEEEEATEGKVYDSSSLVPPRIRSRFVYPG